MGSDSESQKASVLRGATMCVWRIFGVSREWTDRDPDEGGRTVIGQAGPGKDDRITLFVGEIPAHVIRAITEWRAQRPALMNRLFGVGPTDIAEEERSVDARIKEIDLQDVKGRYPLWVTVELSRAYEIEADPAARYMWLRGKVEAVREIEEFGEAASRYLDGALVGIQDALGDQLRLDQLLHGERRAYVLSEGKAAITMPNLAAGSVHGVASVTGWNDLRFDAAELALAGCPSGVTDASKYRTAAGRWLWTALEQDKDALRKFLFSFFGLEVLVNKVAEGGADSRLRKAVQESLSIELGGLPVSELMWPVLRDDESPNRNLLFKFSCLAIWLSRSTATDDIALFRRLSRVRNDLAHGAAADLDELPGSESVELLRRYLCLVAAREGTAGGLFT